MHFQPQERRGLIESIGKTFLAQRDRIVATAISVSMIGVGTVYAFDVAGADLTSVWGGVAVITGTAATRMAYPLIHDLVADDNRRSAERSGPDL